MNILFLNHKIQNCGVYQYGYRLYNILKKSSINTYIYLEIDSYEEYLHNINTLQIQVILYNYNKSTMSWLNKLNIVKNYLNIGIPHESDSSLFDVILSIDPDEVECNNIFNIPRPIYENIHQLCDVNNIENTEIKNFINYNEGNDVPIFGSFGFGFLNKGFDKIIKIINENYDRAIIKLIITRAKFDDNRDFHINCLNQACSLISKKDGIKLLITNTFFTNEDILLFLSNNTCNIFLYDKMETRGISSVIDYAISVNKPFVISDSYMFRHVYNDKICVYKTNIKDAIINSIQLLPALINKYSNLQLINKVDSVISVFNTILGCNVSAFYYTKNYHTDANVTKQVINLYNQYRVKNNNTFNVNNINFGDTCIGKVKKLFINIFNKKINLEIEYKEGETVNWINIIKQIETKISEHDSNHTIQVSIGEIIDKYSILELKQKFISEQTKTQHIINEISLLKKYIRTDISSSHFYKLLLYINEQIWRDTDIIKTIDINKLDETTEKIFIKTSGRIFDNNQKRFRLKNYFNELYDSNIKECKSYSDNVCFININSENDIYDKIPEINYLCISYDVVYFKNLYKKIINKLFKNPNIRFIEDNKLDIINIYELTNYKIEDNIRDYFDFDPIKYTSAGKLGDFLNQLSVVCEKFYETGRKGELFITSQPETFTFGLQFAYDDTYDIIKSQHYIKDYKIYNNERVDIDLSVWRNSIDYTKNWFYIYSNAYNIIWGNHMWIKPIISIYSYWENKIVINCTSYRFFSEKALNKLIVMITPNINDCIFISNEREHYDFFCSKINAKINTKIDYYKPTNLSETITIINSAKECYLGISSMAVIANALHKKHYIFGNIHSGDCSFNNLKNDIKHVVDIF